MIVDKACFERGCACYDDRVDGPGVEMVEKTEKQEPVAWMSSHDVGFKRSEFGDTPTVPLYTTPQPQREWVGLTDEDEIDWDGGDLKSLVKAIEAKLRSKNQ